MTRIIRTDQIASSAREGVQIGARYYWHHDYCKQGHVPLYYVSSLNCVTCTQLRALRTAKENRDRVNFNHRLWYRDNVAVTAARVRKRQLAKLQRTPKWAEIREIEQFCKDCPAGYHVDHVIPLQGRLVSGLHVLNNLQYLSDTENLAKGNKFDPWTFET